MQGEEKQASVSDITLAIVKKIDGAKADLHALIDALKQHIEQQAKKIKELEAQLAEAKKEDAKPQKK